MGSSKIFFLIKSLWRMFQSASWDVSKQEANETNININQALSNQCVTNQQPCFKTDTNQLVSGFP